MAGREGRHRAALSLVAVTVTAGLFAVITYYGHFSDVYATALHQRNRSAPGAAVAPASGPSQGASPAGNNGSTPVTTRIARAWVIRCRASVRPIPGFSAVGVWRVWISGLRDRLALALGAWGVAYSDISALEFCCRSGLSSSATRRSSSGASILPATRLRPSLQHSARPGPGAPARRRALRRRCSCCSRSRVAFASGRAGYSTCHWPLQLMDGAVGVVEEQDGVRIHRRRQREPQDDVRAAWFSRHLSERRAHVSTLLAFQRHVEAPKITREDEVSPILTRRDLDRPPIDPADVDRRAAASLSRRSETARADIRGPARTFRNRSACRRLERRPGWLGTRHWPAPHRGASEASTSREPSAVILPAQIQSRAFSSI